MNFLNAKVVLEADGVHVVLDNGINIKVDKKRETALMNGSYIGKNVIFGIRPEDIYDKTSFVEKHKDTQFTAHVDVYETLGAEVYLYFNIGDTKVTARVEPTTQARQGDTVKFALDLTNYHLFDKDTEVAI